MYSLSRFTLADMTACGATLRKLGKGVPTLEAVAQKLTTYFYQNFQDPYSQEPEFALVRCFQTYPYGALPPDLQSLAQATIAPAPASSALQCLTLLATAGDLPQWNDRTQSHGHQVIPLSSVEMVKQAPMISQLLQQLGLNLEFIVAPDPSLIMDLHEQTYNIFYIPHALNSPFIPAQTEFVKPFQIESVLGFGGILPSGSLIILILFSKCPINRETAELFKPLALNTKMAVLPFDQFYSFNTQPEARS